MKLTKSPRLNALLYEMGIYNYYKVIEHLPRRYDNFSLTKDTDLVDKQRVVVLGRIMSEIEPFKHGKLSAVTFDFISTNRKHFSVIAYNRAYLKQTLKQGGEYTLIGTYDLKKKRLNLINILSGKIPSDESLRPIYSLPNGYSNHLFVNLVKRSFKEIDEIYGDVPYFYMNKYRLIDKKVALEHVHFPSNFEDIRQGMRYLKYEEALKFSLKNKIIKNENKSIDKIRKEPIGIDLCEPFIAKLPYRLSSDQYNAANEIIEDMNQSSLMYRLLQGDVGSGKTVVSFLALYANYLRGDQGALMAPTDALARQHYANALKIFESEKLRIALLLGSTTSEEKRNILDDLKDGTIDIIIGTHALFSKQTIYSSLGLVVIDEQHRFGVNQRKTLMSKGDHADLLMMSATPIPRSLALSIYGDLDVSTLTAFPFSKHEIMTEVVDSDSKEIEHTIKHSLSANRQVYIVAPLIELREDERYSVDKLAAKYLLKYPGLVAVLHGKMKKDEKDAALAEFYTGIKPILVSTSVIEVGIDVKTAGTMIIYDANNFGLSSLHQLRGRVGRDGQEAKCLLVYDKDDEETTEKLNVLVNSNDGFYIAEQDLKLRGPGELTGFKQTGLPNFTFLNIVADIKIFQVASLDADYVLMHKSEKQFHWLIDKCIKEIEKEDIVRV
ncbi:MAG: ATP-dependent DNA helicase RecG [Erysipelotrichaceae bacterium]|jgi:ATP-dependent DNA helicase RecG|nr:ATP-dependent DNA helicase RecG [Erysipelotrichaceae bacterium]